MGGCRNHSGQIPFVQPSPEVIGAEVTDGTPFNVKIDLEFSKPMNTALTPGNVNVELVYDGNPSWLTFNSWADTTHARYRYAMAWPPTNATVQLKVVDPELRDVLNAVCETSEAFVIVP